MAFFGEKKKGDDFVPPATEQVVATGMDSNIDCMNLLYGLFIVFFFIEQMKTTNTKASFKMWIEHTLALHGPLTTTLCVWLLVPVP